MPGSSGQAGPDDDGGCPVVVAAGSRSQQSAATSNSAQEVEDCEELEVAGVHPDDSRTNIIGPEPVTWTAKAKNDNRFTGDETRTEKSEDLPEQSDRRRTQDEDDDDDESDVDVGGGEPVAINPPVAASCQNSTRAGGLQKNPGRSDSLGNAHYHNNDNDGRPNDGDDGGDCSKPGNVADKLRLPTSSQSSTQMVAALSQISDQRDKSENLQNADDDFDDDDDDDDSDESTGINPTFAMLASAGGDRPSSVSGHDKGETAAGGDSLSRGDVPILATPAAAISAQPARSVVPGNRCLYGAGVEDEESADDADDKDDLHEVDQVRENNGRRAVSIMAASDSFDDVFEKNLSNSQPHAADRNGSATYKSSQLSESCSPRRNDVEESEERAAVDSSTGDRVGTNRRTNKSANGVLSHSRYDGNRRVEEQSDEVFSKRARTGSRCETETSSLQDEGRPADRKINNTEREVRPRHMIIWTHAQRASKLYFADVFFIFFYSRLSWPNG